MITPVSSTDWRIRKAYSTWFRDAYQPNVAVTATLAQSISYEAPRGKGWQRGNPICFEGEYHRFVRSLSREVYGQSLYRRTKKRVPNCASVEGDGVIMPYHLHMALQRPSWMTVKDFNSAILMTWFQSPWAKPDIRIEEIAGDWVGYCFKKGPEALLFA
jgi:hypothetical protein